MFTREQLTELLQQSNWPAEEKQKLLGMVPKLGSNTINFLYREVDTFFSEITADIVVTTVEKTTNAVKNFSSNPSELIQILNTAPDDPDFDFGKYIVPIIADSRSPIVTNGATREALLKFELRLIKELPESELLEVVKTSTSYFVSNCNLLMEFKRINFLRGIGEDKNWGRQYVTALENSEELFGSKEVYITGKKYPGHIKNWIKDFIASIPVAVSERTTFEEVQYLKRSPNASKLSQVQQQQLLDIIKLYRWFLDPFVTEEEVTEYENKLNAKLYPPETEVETETVQQVPSVPKSLNFGFKKPVEDVSAPASTIKPPVMPPFKATPASVQEILNKKSIPTQVRAPGVRPVAAPQQIATKQQDIKKAPLNSIADILEQKKMLEKKIDEKIEDLKKRTIKN